MSKKEINVVTCKIQEENGRFWLAVTQTKESGKSVMAGMHTSCPTHEEAIERATAQIKRFLMPVRYNDEPLDLELEEVE